MKKHIKKYFIPHEENEYKPHFFRGRSMSVFVFALAVFFISSVFLSRNIGWITENCASIISGVLVQLANEDREAANLNQFVISPKLEEAAKMKAEDMVKNSYFAHVSPEGVSPWHWFKKAGYDYVFAGENLAINFYDSKDVEKAWMNSPGHRDNILNNRFTEIGIAVATGMYQGRETTFVVQMFGYPAAPVAMAPVLPPVPTPVPSFSPTPSISPLPSVTPVVASVVLEESENFIAIKNVEDAGAVLPVDVLSVKSEASSAPWLVSLALSPRSVFGFLYSALFVLVFFALALMFFIELKKQSLRHIVYAVAVLSVIAVLVFINQYWVFPSVIIR